MKRYSIRRVNNIIAENDSRIENICNACHIPSACLKAVLRMELPEINFSDDAADFVVSLNWLRYSIFHGYALERHTRNPLHKFDSSTGYGQIFSQVAIEAILFAKMQGIAAPDISGELSPDNPDDLKRVWMRLHHDQEFNLTCSALNLLHAAYQMTGRISFSTFSPEEMKLVFSRYNGNVKHITPYGEKAYRYYLEYGGN